MAPLRTLAMGGIGPLGGTMQIAVANPRWLLSRRQRNAKPRPTARPVFHCYSPTKTQNQVPCDGKTEPGPATITVARGLKTQERLENSLALAWWHARPAIIDQHDRFCPNLRQRDRRFASVFHRIVDQVANDACERGRITPDTDRRH